MLSSRNFTEVSDNKSVNVSVGTKDKVVSARQRDSLEKLNRQMILC